MMNNIQTREQLDDFRERLGQVGWADSTFGIQHSAK
jgi:hypothetical protein